MSPTGDPAGRRRATSADAFTSAIAAAATGVTVVATDGRSGRFGQTVSAMCRVSVSPPLVLACLHGRSPVSDAIRANGVFCVSVLGVQHDVVADTFRPALARHEAVGLRLLPLGGRPVRLAPDHRRCCGLRLRRPPGHPGRNAPYLPRAGPGRHHRRWRATPIQRTHIFAAGAVRTVRVRL